jgi:predicted nucleic acid-binding Zn ribbon protein
VPWSPLPQDRGRDPERVGTSLDRVLKGMGVPDAQGITTVFDDWAGVVGEVTAQRTRPVAIDHGTLVIATDEPAVATQVRYLEPQLLARLATVCGEGRVTKVVVRVEGGAGRRRGSRPDRRR